MDQSSTLQEQKEELIARMLKLHARWDIADLDTYRETIVHLDVLVTVAAEMADSLDQRLWERENSQSAEGWPNFWPSTRETGEGERN